MKQLTRKLFLSIFTLAVCAVTLVSTTFAWYTTNTEAAANAVNASTTSATTDGSILVSADATVEKPLWSSVCTPNTNNMTTMVPLQVRTTTSGSDTFVTLDGTPSTSYLEFKVYFKTTKTDGGSDSKVAVYLKNIVVENAASNSNPLTSQDNLLWNPAANNGQGAPLQTYAPNKSTYKVDMVRALNLYTFANDNALSTNDLDLTGIGTIKTALEEGLHDSVNAESYYEEVMNKQIASNKLSETDTTTYEAATTMSKTENDYNAILLGNIDNSKAESATGKNDAEYKVLCVTFRVYLDGWDQYCFDACKGQTFSISLTFTAKESEVSLGAKKVSTGA